MTWTPCLHNTSAPNRPSAVGSLSQRQASHPCRKLTADLKTSLPKRLHFASPDRIIELVERGGGFPNQESRLMLEEGISMGRGGVFLSLTDEQYEKLRR